MCVFVRERKCSTMVVSVGVSVFQCVRSGMELITCLQISWPFRKKKQGSPKL